MHSTRGWKYSNNRMRLHYFGTGKGTWMYSSIINNARSDEPTKNSLLPHTTNHAPEEPRSHVLRPDLIRKLVVNPDHKARKPINTSANLPNNYDTDVANDDYYDDMLVEPSEHLLSIVSTERIQMLTPIPDEDNIGERPVASPLTERPQPRAIPNWRPENGSATSLPEFDALLKTSEDYKVWLDLKNDFLKKESHLLYGTDIPVSTDYQV